jgi:hypothetical protein
MQSHPLSPFGNSNQATGDEVTCLPEKYTPDGTVQSGGLILLFRRGPLLNWFDENTPVAWAQFQRFALRNTEDIPQRLKRLCNPASPAQHGFRMLQSCREPFSISRVEHGKSSRCHFSTPYSLSRTMTVANCSSRNSRAAIARKNPCLLRRFRVAIPRCASP